MLEGKHVQLAQLTKEDLPLLLQWRNSISLKRLTGPGPFLPISVEQIDLSSTSTQIQFGIRELSSDSLVGYITLANIIWSNRTAGLGVYIGELEQFGKGWGSEAISLLLDYAFDELNLHQAGIKRSDISDFIAWRTIGLNTTDIPRERDSVNVVIRDNQQIEIANSQYIMNSVILNNKGQQYPLSLFATPEFIGESPTLNRWRGYNSQLIKSEVSQNINPTVVIEKLQDEFMVIADKYSVIVDIDGIAAETSDSNAALLKTLPIGVLLLFGALILQFNSYRIAGLVMLTIPLAMIGVFPTLLLVGVNFGFMSVLGLLALTGIVVNTAIILIDSVLVKIKDEGLALLSAIEQSTKERFRPVVLTACTTIIGMIPLTSPTSPLWPPMAWTIIGGLLTSTILTLLVLPAFLKLVLNEEKIKGIA